MYSIFLDFFKSFSIDIFFAISLFALYAVVNLTKIAKAICVSVRILVGTSGLELSTIIAYVSSSSFPDVLRRLVGTSGLEPPTSRLSGECTNQLSYVPILYWLAGLIGSVRIYSLHFTAVTVMVEVSGIEPLTPCLQGRCSPSWAIPPKRSGSAWQKINAPTIGAQIY